MQTTRPQFTQSPIRFENSATLPYFNYSLTRFATSTRDIIGNGSITGTDENELLLGDGTWTVEARPTITVVTFARVTSDDVMRGGGGNDTLEGRAGNDRLLGGAGRDVLRGGDGDDLLSEAGDVDGGNTLDGGAGADTLLSGGGGNDSLSGWDGRDRLMAGGGHRATLSGGAGDDTLLGAAGNDVLWAGSSPLRPGSDADVAFGFGGADHISADGQATLDGGAGDDSLFGAGGGASLVGLDGNDALYGGAPGGSTLDGGAGNDFLGQTVISGWVYTGRGAPDLLFGRDGDDGISGHNGASTLDGGAGNDRLSSSWSAGDASGLLLLGGDGADTLTSGRGGDTLLGGDGNDVATAAPTWDARLPRLGALLDGADGRDLLTGSNAADTLLGGTGNDVLDALAGGDLLIGGAGNDMLHVSLDTGAALAVVLGDGAGAAVGYDLLQVWTHDLPVTARVTLSQGIAGDGDGVMLRVDGAPRVAIAGDVENFWVRFDSGFPPTSPQLALGSYALGKSAYGELAALAWHAYSDTPLNVANGQWIGSGLRPVMGIELGLGPRGKLADGADYSMLNGIYRADGAFGGESGAVAHVYRAQEGWFIAFRGTDSRPRAGDLSDQADWLDVANHYARFKPLVDAVKTLSADVPIFVTGHSLGGAMAQMLHADLAGKGFTVTFGAPGAPTPMAGRLGTLTHVELTQDIVPFAGPLALGATAVAEVLQMAPSLPTRLIGAAIEQAADEVAAYRKPGVTLRLPESATQRPQDIGSIEHDMLRYLARAAAIDRAIEDDQLRPGGDLQLGDRVVRVTPFVNDLDLVLGVGLVEADATAIVYSSGRVHRDGDDLLLGARGPDRLIGHAGRDTLVGLGGPDVLEGGAGNDLFVVSWAEGAGTALPDFEPHDRLQLTFVPTTAGASAQLTVVNGRQQLTITIAGHGERSFTMGADAWVGAAWSLFPSGPLPLLETGGNTLVFSLGGSVARGGTAAADTLNGTAGNDTLTAGDGDDLLIGASGSGNDSLVGGQGQDRVIYRSATESVSLDLALGRANGVGIGFDTLSGIEHADGGAAADTMAGDGAGNALAGFGGNDLLLGRDGADTLQGGLGADSVAGGGGADALFGGAGADTLDGGDGTDRVMGGRGDDLYLLRAGDRAVEAVDEGFDTAWAMDGPTAVLADHIEALVLQGPGILNGFGNAQDNLITGNGVANTLVGRGGADTLLGGAGHDRFRFEVAADSAPDAPDLLSDFTFGEAAARDRIDLRGIDARPDLVADQAFAWIGRAAFSGAGGEVRAAGGEPGAWRVAADIDGDRTADLVIVVATATGPVGSWFLL